MASRATSAMLLTLGLVAGLAGLVLGGYLASGNNGWPSSLLYSVVGLVGAPLTTLSWTSRRSARRELMAGIALIIGMLASMGLLYDLTRELSEIRLAWSQAPLAVSAWLAIWIAWPVAALARLIWFKPPRRLRQRLSSRRGDAGR